MIVRAPKEDALGMGTELGQGELVIGRLSGTFEFGFSYKGIHRDYEFPIGVLELVPHDSQRNADGSLRNLSRGFYAELDRIEKEALSLSKNRNARTISVYKTIRQNNTIYVLTELPVGVTLSDRIQEDDLASTSEATQLAIDICEALTIPHSKGVLHGQVNPTTVMTLPEGRSILLDLTWLMKPVSRGFPITDIYSFGAVLYFSLTGVLPKDEHIHLGDDFLRSGTVEGLDVNQGLTKVIHAALCVRRTDGPRAIRQFQWMLQDPEVNIEDAGGINYRSEAEDLEEDSVELFVQIPEVSAKKATSDPSSEEPVGTTPRNRQRRPLSSQDKEAPSPIKHRLFWLSLSLLSIVSIGLFLSWQTYVSTVQRRQDLALPAVPSAPTRTPKLTPTLTPTLVPTPVPTPMFFTTTTKFPQVHLRAAPTVEADSLGFLLAEEAVTVVGRTADSEWVRVESGKLSGWSAAWTLNVEEHLAELPVMEP